MTTTDVRLTVARILDGMKFNKEKLARDCIVVCDQVDRLNAALLQEQQKNAALRKELEKAQQTHNDADSSFSKEFGNLFENLFKPGPKT
jgi:TorA maturation chaperone TorD